MDEKLLNAAMEVQLKEITEYHVYTRLAEICKDPHNAEVLRTIGEEEKRHSLYWQEKTGKEIKPPPFKVFWSILKARVLRLTLQIPVSYKQPPKLTSPTGSLRKQFCIS